MTPEIVAFMKEIAGSRNVFAVNIICRNESLLCRTIKLVELSVTTVSINDIFSLDVI